MLYLTKLILLVTINKSGRNIRMNFTYGSHGRLPSAIWKRIALLFGGGGCLIFPAKSGAFKTHGRVTFGGYSSTETFKDTSAGSTSNDFMRMAGRLHLKLSDIDTEKYIFTADVADKFDGFGKLNRTEYQLDPNNVWQTKQLSFANPNSNGDYFYEVGRFPLLDAGNLSCDGVQLGYRQTSAISLGAFGGLNPRRIDQLYYTFNSQSNIYGFFFAYRPKDNEWNKNFLLNHALVQETVNGETDRQYLFHNMFWQWQESSRLLTNLYLDMVPKTFIQNGSVNWQQSWNPEFSTEFSYLTYDVITYLRQQNVREQLPSSPYHESNAAFREQWNKQTLFELSFRQGERDLDHLTKSKVTLGTRFMQIWGKRFDAYLKLSSGKNFISNDNYITLGLGYYSDKWEFNIDENLGTEKYDNGTTLHPLISEISASRVLSQQLFISTSLQSASDERVQILSAFLRLGYRFGNQEIPPIRDGAPPRGKL